MESKHEESSSGLSTDKIDEEILLRYKSKVASTQNLELETQSLSNTMSSDNTQGPNHIICQPLFLSQASSSSSNKNSQSSTSTIADQTPASKHISQYDTEDFIRDNIPQPNEPTTSHIQHNVDTLEDERPPPL